MDAKKLLKWIIAIIIFTPIAVNFSLMGTTPITFGDDWQGFFGDYLGAIIGGIVAFFIAYYQIEKQRQENEERDLENNRSYINAEDYYAPIGLEGTKHREFSKILNTENYQSYISSRSHTSLKNTHITYYKISHNGLPDIILDCKITVDLSEEEGKNPSQIVAYVGVFEKTIDIFVPLVKKEKEKEKEKEIYINQLCVEYTTLKGERILYKLDIKNKKESHYLLKNGDIVPLFHFSLESSNWIYPNSKMRSQ
ncbi:hypothetical protein [Bacillus pseudomycoides]|uniref:hypothetical protein n=1 Tax=Bacillus pseudomycoides TaxID=64104 RepID=UPI00115541F1|nr:hypothetical protein [Bacillus pseudomycoides]